MMVERLKQQRTSHSCRNLLKICVKMEASWSAQTFRQAEEIPSGPEAFLDFCLLKNRFTSSTQTLSAGGLVGGREGGCRWMRADEWSADQSGCWVSVWPFQIDSKTLWDHQPIVDSCLVLGDVPQTSPYWCRIVCWKFFFQLLRVVLFSHSGLLC